MLSGFVYDGAGNLTNDSTGAIMACDGENRLKSHTQLGATTAYEYDGDGRRVKKVAGGVTVVYVYNASGQLIAEYDTNAALPSSAGGTKYVTADPLGSARVVVDGGGAVKGRHDYLPFGEEIAASVGGRSSVVGYTASDTTRQRFTGKERDSESGLDYFLARYYSAAQGRFTSIDPYNPISQSEDEDDFKTYLNQPQAWNRYTYTINNPLKYIDPNGERWFYTQENGEIVEARWVEPNPDGTYTSPGEGWIEFVPTEQQPYLQVLSGDGYVAYHFWENEDGSAGFRGISTGRVEDASGDLILGAIGLRLSARAAAAVGTWYKGYRELRKAKDAIEDIFGNAEKLRGKTPAEVEAQIGRMPPNWRIEGMRHSQSNPGGGWVLREYGVNGQPTGRMIQWHPGGGHHGPHPYWKVSSSKTGTVRIGPQF